MVKRNAKHAFREKLEKFQFRKLLHFFFLSPTSRFEIWKLQTIPLSLRRIPAMLSSVLSLWQFLILAAFFSGSNAQSATSTSASAGQTVVITGKYLSLCWDWIIIIHIVCLVADVTSSNATSVFSPSQVTAAEGALVLFNFTQGNHTATQSTFTSPCLPINATGSNGFDDPPLSRLDIY